MHSAKEVYRPSLQNAFYEGSNRPCFRMHSTKEGNRPCLQNAFYEGSNRPCLQNADLRSRVYYFLRRICRSTKEVYYFLRRSAFCKQGINSFVDPACRMQIYEGSNRPCLQNADLRCEVIDPASQICRSTKEVIDLACRMHYEGSNYLLRRMQICKQGL